MTVIENILKTTLVGLFFGTFGTTIGGIIGVKLKNPSNIRIYIIFCVRINDCYYMF